MLCNTRVSRIIPRIEPRKFTPTKLSQIPSRPKRQREVRTMRGKTRAIETAISVAKKGFYVAADAQIVVHCEKYGGQRTTERICPQISY